VENKSRSAYHVRPHIIRPDYVTDFAKSGYGGFKFYPAKGHNGMARPQVAGAGDDLQR
jgi:hypothetical protein